jgi:hypothetical protein
MHINSISCGQGAPSLFLIVLAGEGYFDADVVITADTGWETDMLWSDGNRTDAETFFNEVTKPLANRYDIDAMFVRTLNRDGNRYPALQDAQSPGKEDIPMYGSNGGKLRQSCTSKWKKQAIRQELRRRGARTAISYLGLTMSEVHRIRPNDVQWESLAWPMIGYPGRPEWNQAWYRVQADEGLNKRGIPYLITSQCDGCPHKDFFRWSNNTPEKIEELTEFEAQWNGEQFLTRELIPLPQAIERMRARKPTDELFDVCENGYCFV